MIRNGSFSEHESSFAQTGMTTGSIVHFNICASKGLKEFNFDSIREDIGDLIGRNEYKVLIAKERQRCVYDLHASVFNSKCYKQIMVTNDTASDVFTFQVLISHTLLRKTSIQFCKNPALFNECDRISFCQIFDAFYEHKV